MSRSGTLAALVAFLIILYGVPIGQAVREMKSGQRVQILDLFEDWLVTPVRYRADRAEVAARLAGKVDSLASALSMPGQHRAAALADDAVFLVDDVRKTALAINRHSTLDADDPLLGRLERMHTKLQSLEADLADGVEAVHTTDERLVFVRAEVDELVRENQPAGLFAYPLLITQSFLYTVFSGRYLRQYETELEDNSWAINVTRPTMQFLWYWVLHNPGEKAVVGEEDWLYYKPDVDYLVLPDVYDPRSMVVDANDVPYREDPVRAIVTFRDQLAQRGIELLVVIVPGKPSVYPDLLSRAVAAEKSGTLGHSLLLMERLAGHNVETVDLFAPFARERARDDEAGERLFLAHDTHWRSRGVVLTASVVAERIREYPWFRQGETEYVLDTITVDRVGDIGVMTALPDFRVRNLFMQFRPEPTRCYQVFNVVRNEEGEEVSRSLYRDDMRLSSILVLGDSFSRIYQTDEPRGAGWIAHLAAELSQPVGSIVSDGGASTLVRQTLERRANVLRGKKLVVWEFVERDIRFGAEGWQDVVIDF